MHPESSTFKSLEEEKGIKKKLEDLFGPEKEGEKEAAHLDGEEK